MAKRRTRRQRRRAERMQKIMTGLCVVVLVAGSVYFVHGKLANDRVRETNAKLRESFHAAEAAQAAPEATPELVAALPEEETVLPVPEEETVRPALNGESVLSAEEPETGAVALVRRPKEVRAELLQAEPEVAQGAAVALSAVQDIPNPFDMPVAVDTPAQRQLQSAFEELYAQNNDLIGWIKMADSVDYPVLWRDNSFYMDHDFYGEYSQAGSIFLDARNAVDMNDSAMLIYGHNMRSGEMFGDLDDYRKAEYLKKYPVISLQNAWESEPRKYVLISLFDASMNKNDPSYIRIVRTAFESDAEKEGFIEEMRARSIFDIPVEAGAEDQLLTLVTCSYSHDNGRFLLFARSLRDGETEESIQALFQSGL